MRDGARNVKENGHNAETAQVLTIADAVRKGAQFPELIAAETIEWQSRD